MSNKITKLWDWPIKEWPIFTPLFSSFFNDENSKKLGDCSFYQEDNEYIIEITTGDIPKDAWNINIEENNVIVNVSQNKRESEMTSDNQYRDSSQYNTFSGSYYIPDDCTPEKISASCNDGILKIKIPKNTSVKNKNEKINVTIED